MTRVIEYAALRQLSVRPEPTRTLQPRLTLPSQRTLRSAENRKKYREHSGIHAA